MKLTLSLVTLVALAVNARAGLKLPAIIGDNMVLQQKQANPIWGWDAPGTAVTVSFAGQTKNAKAGADGRWTVKLDAVPANAKPQSIAIKGTSERELKNVLVGEVWVCSGQSNMQFAVQSNWDSDLEIATAKYPQIRLITVPNVGTQEPQTDFKGEWRECGPETVGGFSAAGYFFGRVLHRTLDIPVGLINDSWGGSAAEAWVRRDVLEKDARFKLLMENTRKREAELQSAAGKANYEKQLAAWKQREADAKKAGKPFIERAPQAPDAWLRGNARPGNIFNGVLLPTIGYGIKGVIWYQGESNAGRAYEYASLFPRMIQHWREEWGQGDFPFYWVQLADFMAEKTDAMQSVASSWAELREAQTRTQSAIKNGGQAVIIDLGEGNDIHPKNKRDVAERLARWALAKDYGVKIPYRSPEYKSVEFTAAKPVPHGIEPIGGQANNSRPAPFYGGKAVITIDTFGSALRTLDVAEAKGFVMCGEDKRWQWAQAKLIGPDKIEVSAAGIVKPVAVRYAWADNPVCNVYSVQGLPLTPFRTDDFEMLTKPKF